MSDPGQSLMHPVQYEADFTAQRSRVTTFFRIILVIPHLVVLLLWGLAAYVTTFVAWFAILITGSYPKGLWGFAARYFVYAGRVNGYSGLLTDVYPPFGADGDYPVRVTAERSDRQSRLTTLFRYILVIPAAVGAYLLGIAQNAVTFLAWLVILFTGKMPLPLQNFILFVHRFSVRTTAYGLLLVDAYPSFAEGDAPAAAGAVTAANDPAAPPAW
jgi:hypothetical protein